MQKLNKLNTIKYKTTVKLKERISPNSNKSKVKYWSLLDNSASIIKNIYK